MPDPKNSEGLNLLVSPSKSNNNLGTTEISTYDQSYNTERLDLLGGFVPAGLQSPSDLDNLRGINQSNTETAINNLTTFSVKTVGNLIEGVGYLTGTVNGLAKVIDPSSDTKVSDFTDNPIREAGTALNEYIDKAFPNYDSTDEKENPVALRNIVGTVMNSTFRDAAPFMAAAYIEGYGIGKILQTPAKIARLTKIAESGGELAGKANQLSKLIQKAPQEITQLLINNGEAMLEADNTSDQIFEDVYAKEMSKHGDEELATQLADAAKTESFKNIWALNMAVLKINNLETRSLFKPSLYSRRPLKELAKEWGNLTTKASKAQFIAQKGWNYLSDPIKEASEELLQGGASQAVSDRMLSEGGDTKLSSEELFNSAVDTLINGVNRVGTEEGVLEMLTSAILSGPISTYHKSKAAQDERNNQLKRKGIYDSSIKSDYKEIEDLTTEVGDSTGNFKKVLSDKGKELISTANSYNEFENLKNIALVTDDQSLYQIARDTQLANMSFGHFEMGLGETLESKISEISKEVGQELRANGRTTIEDFATGQNISVEQYTAQLKEKIKNYENVYNILENQYSLPTPELRQAAFTNGILQSELKKKIQNPKPVVGQAWLEYQAKFVDPKMSDIDAIQLPAKELKELEGKTDLNSIQKSIELNAVIQDYKNLKNFNADSTDFDAQTNLKNYKDNKLNRLYYDALKQQFKTLTDPKSAKPYIESKVEQSDKKTNPLTPNTQTSVKSSEQPVTATSTRPGSDTKESPIMGDQESSEDAKSLADLLTATGNEDLIESIEPEIPEVFRDPNLDAAIEYSEKIANSASEEFDSSIIDDAEEPDTKDSNRDSSKSISEINETITTKENQAKNIKNSIPLYITNRFEKVVDGKIPVDIKTGETELENQEALKLLLSLKQGDLVDAQVGFYYPNSSKPDGDFLTYQQALNSKKSLSSKNLAVRLFKNGIKLGAIKHNQEQDIEDIFNNIESKPELQDNIINTPLEVSSKWSGFIRSLANKNLEPYYKDVPFEDRAYLNSPSSVTGAKDFVVITVNKEGDIKVPNKYTPKNYSYLGLTSPTDLVGKVAVGYLRPGIMYTLIKSPDGKIIPLATNGEYITEENAKYVIDEISKAKSTKGSSLKELEQKISPFIYWDSTNGFSLTKGKIYYKGKEISLEEMKNIVKTYYKPINLKTVTNKQLDSILKLNVPKATSIQFINPKVTLNLSPLKSIEEIRESSAEAESTLENISTTNDINYDQEVYNEFSSVIRPTTIDDIIEEESNINPSDLISQYLQGNTPSTILDPGSEIATIQDLENLLRKYNKNIKDITFNIKELDTFTVSELEQIIKCL